MTEPIRLNGVAHLYITVADYELCRPFYRALLPFLGMECLVETDSLYYCVGSRTGIGVRAAAAEHHGTPFDQLRAGLHHLCLRAYTPEDVDRVHDFVVELGGKVVHAPQQDDWAAGYYSVLFEDPGGTRLEVNHVPGRGNLETSVELPLRIGVQERLSKD